MAFPQTLDNFTNPTPSTPTNSPVTPLSGQLSQLNNAVEAIEGVIGVTGSTVPTSLDKRIQVAQAGADDAAAALVVLDNRIQVAQAGADDAAAALVVHAAAADPHSVYLLKNAHYAVHAQMGIGPVLPASIVADIDASAWSKAGGPTGSSVSASPVQGMAARLTTNNGTLGYVIARREIAPVLLSASDLVTFEINVPDSFQTRSVVFRLLVDTAGRRFRTAAYEFWHPGRNTFSIRVDDMTAEGGALSSDLFQYVQVEPAGPAAFAKQISIDVGRVWIGGRSRAPLCCITFDAQYVKVYDWAFKHMKKLGLPGNIYIAGERIGQAAYMNLAQVQEVVANGWELGLYSYWTGWGANSHNVTGVCQAQSVAQGAAFQINGAFSSAGVATFDVPRYVTCSIASGNENTNGYTITGTDEDGNAYSEQILGPSSTMKIATERKFSSVTGIVALNATSVNVSFGTARGSEDFTASAEAGQDWLQAHGFPVARDWAHPLDEHNNDTPVWLAQQGFLTARTTVTGSTLMREGAPGVETNRLFMPAAVTIGDQSSAASLKTQIDNAVLRGCDFFILGHLNSAQSPSESELKTSLAYLASLHREGSINITTFSEFRKARGLA